MFQSAIEILKPKPSFFFARFCEENGLIMAIIVVATAVRRGGVLVACMLPTSSKRRRGVRSR